MKAVTRRIQEGGSTNASDLTGHGAHDDHDPGGRDDRGRRGGDPPGDGDVRSPYRARRRRDLFVQREDGGVDQPVGDQGARPGDEGAWPGKSGAPPGEWPAEETARRVCLDLLSRGPRTRTQLADALRKCGVADDVGEFVLGRFAEVGLIDDAAFARAWVESRHHSRGLSGKMLAAELQRRGVDTEDVRAAVDTLGPGAEVETARRLVAKRLPATRGRPLPTRARQLVGLLARKGYPASLAYRVVREALEQDIVNSDTPRVDRLRLEQIDLAAAEDSAIDADPLGEPSADA